jgi:hypothetical protein
MLIVADGARVPAERVSEVVASHRVVIAMLCWYGLSESSSQPHQDKW